MKNVNRAKRILKNLEEQKIIMQIDLKKRRLEKEKLLKNENFDGKKRKNKKVYEKFEKRRPIILRKEYSVFHFFFQNLLIAFSKS